MKIIVTGAAGFIGANNVKALNERGETDIIAVDNLQRSAKFGNLVDCDFAEYFDKDSFIELVRRRALPKASLVFHQGACSDTMETDGRYMMANNYRYSIELFDWCQETATPLIYASSGSVYGLGPVFVEQPENERPLNIYGYSKLLFDRYVRQRISTLKAPAVGLRYFNVYGPRESHKGRMASVAFHHYRQFSAEGHVELFEGSHGFANGEQQRDFIHVDDIVRGNMHFAERPVSGIYNLGTGHAQTFNDVAVALVNAMREASGEPALPLARLVTAGLIEYVDFPPALRGKYQAYTEADLTQLRKAGCDLSFMSVEQGVAQYVTWLRAQT